MKLLLKILFFIIAMIITVEDCTSSTVINLSQETTTYQFQQEESNICSFVFENYSEKYCFKEEKVVTCSERGKERETIVAKGGTSAFRSFTSSNFRHNLGKMTGNIPANSQAHHVFPQKFASQFSKAGINIHDPKYGVWWNSSSHLQNAAGYNAAWSNFLSINPSQTQILNYGRQLMNQYGIPVFF